MWNLARGIIALGPVPNNFFASYLPGPGIFAFVERSYRVDVGNLGLKRKLIT